MNILLVKPHVSLAVARNLYSFLHLEPLELEIVAGGVDHRHEVRILDLTTERNPLQAFKQAIVQGKPGLIGFTGFSNQAGNVKKLAELAKTLLPEVRVVVGGLHATIIPADYGACPSIDWVVRGEGGTVMREIVASMEAGRVPPETERILHVGSSRFAGQAAQNPPSPPDKFDAMPAPRRALVDRSRYFCAWGGRPGERAATLFPRTARMQTSMGCPYRCSFCVVHYVCNGRYIPKSPEAVADEIASIPESHIYFVDDEMFIDAKRCDAIARELIRRGIRKRYISWARCDTICRHPETFALWKEAGLDLLYVGVESLDEQTLKNYNKRCDAETNRKAIAILREQGIALHAAIMIHPDFSKDDFLRLRETIALLNPCEFTFTVFSPPPGTPLWKEHRDRFICPDPYAFYDCMHTLLPTKLPLKAFYRYFSLLYLLSFRDNPWRRHRIRVPFRDMLRLFVSGARFGWSLRNMFKAYDRRYWMRSPAELLGPPSANASETAENAVTSYEGSAP